MSVGLSSESRVTSRREEKTFASFVVDEKKEGNYIPMHTRTASDYHYLTEIRDNKPTLPSFCLRLWGGRKPKNNGVAGVDHT